MDAEPLSAACVSCIMCLRCTVRVNAVFSSFQAAKCIQTMETVSEQKRRWLILASACLEMFLFSGIFFGWSSLMFILKQEGIFSHLCAKDVNNSTNSPSDAGTDDMGLNQANVLSPVAPSNQTTQNWSFSGETSGYRTSSGLSNCLAQDNMLSLCFTVSTALLYTSTSLAGALTYKLGTRIARLAGWYVTFMESFIDLHSFPLIWSASV